MQLAVGTALETTAQDVAVHDGIEGLRGDTHHQCLSGPHGANLIVPVPTRKLHLRNSF